MIYEEIDINLYEKYILLTEYYDDGVLRKCHLTRNKKYLPNTLPDGFDKFTDANYFYNLDLEQFERIPCHKIDITHHLPYIKINAKSFLEYINFNNTDEIDKINDETYKNINSRLTTIKQAINLAKTFTTLKNSDIEIYRKLFCSKILNEHNCCFSLIFGLSPSHYENGDINAELVKNKFNEILNFYKNKAFDNLNLELEGLSDDEMEEMVIIKQMIQDSVDETIDKYKDVSNLVDLFEDWPAILLPAPEFISNSENDTSYQDCLWAFDKS